MINLAKIEALLGADSSDAEYIEKMAIGYINSLLWYKISDQEYIFEADVLHTEDFLPQYPVSSITSIKYNTGDAFSPSEEDWQTVDSWDYRTVGTAGKIITRSFIGYPVKITYRSGYTSYTPAVEGGAEAIEGNYPAEIEQAIMVVAKYIINGSDLIGRNDIKVEIVDGDKTEFVLPSEQLKQLDILLSNFYRYDVVA